MLKCKHYIELNGRKVFVSARMAALFEVLREAKGAVVGMDQVACATFGEHRTYYGKGVSNADIYFIVRQLRRRISSVSQDRKYIFRDEDGYRMNVKGELIDG